jgi:hypothetical protein
LSIRVLGLRDEVVFATDRGYEKVIFETYCVVLLNHWESHVCDISVIKLIIDEIAKLVNLFSSIAFALSVARLTKRLTITQNMLQYMRVLFTWNVEPPAFRSQP